MCCTPPQAQRIEVKISKKDEQQKSFWLGLGFEVHDDIAEMPIDAALLGRVGSSGPPPPAPTVVTGAPSGAASSSSGGGGGVPKKRGRPAATSVPAAASGHQPSPQLPPNLEQQEEEEPQAHRSLNAAAPPRPQQHPSAHQQPSQPPVLPLATSMPDFVPIGTESGSGHDNDDDGPEGTTDVYIRKTCPGGGEPHLVVMPAGSVPPGAAVWHLVPEQELDLGHTVQCLECRRVFLVARDQAESADNLFIDQPYRLID